MNSNVLSPNKSPQKKKQEGTENLTFEEIWKQVNGLPDTAILQVPSALAETTKRKLAQRTPEEIKKIVEEAVEEINHGSIARLDELISKRL